MGQKPHTKEQDEAMQSSQGIGGPRLRIPHVISYHNNWSLQQLSEPFVKSKHFVNKALVMDPYTAGQDAGPVAIKTSLLTTMCLFQHMARGKITQCWSR
jgi:hypothetical protein